MWAITKKSAACSFRSRSRTDAREIRTNKKLLSKKPNPTSRWMTRSFIFRQRLPNNFLQSCTYKNFSRSFQILSLYLHLVARNPHPNLLPQGEGTAERASALLRPLFRTPDHSASPFGRGLR